MRSFATFFRSYMSASTILVAALPIPVTSWKLIPAFEAQRGVLSVYTPLLCFLLVSFLFFSRHSLAVLMFPLGRRSSKRPLRPLVSLLPLALIILAIFSAVQYHLTLNSSIQTLKHEFTTVATQRYQSGEFANIEDFNQLPDGTITFSGAWLLRNILFDKVSNAGLAHFLLYSAIRVCRGGVCFNGLEGIPARHPPNFRCSDYYAKRLTMRCSELGALAFSYRARLSSDRRAHSRAPGPESLSLRSLGDFARLPQSKPPNTVPA